MRVVELSLRIHENPFAIPDYHQRDHAIVMEFLDESQFGMGFERFMGSIIDHLGCA